VETPQTIEIEVADRVALIRLARPDRLNAFTTRMGVELFGALAELDRDDAVRAIIITGKGRAFCAGADLDPGGKTFDPRWEASRVAEDKVKPWTLCTPTIAAINGAAVGVGATLPLLWDIRIASDQARIAFPFTRRGIAPEAGSTWILPRLIGMSAAMDLLLTGRTVSAHEALALGLVSRVVPPAELGPTAIAIARDIADNTAPVSVALTRRLLWRQLATSDPVEGRSQEDAVFQWTTRQPDAPEGIKSFLEKRRPVWTLRAPSDVPDT
jgi:enoyl-CoA hydratase/carnithine racemase